MLGLVVSVEHPKFLLAVVFKLYTLVFAFRPVIKTI